MKITVYNTIYGKYDTLKLQPKQSIDIAFVCFYDEFPDKEEGTNNQRNVERSGTYQHLNSRMQGKYMKFHPFMHINSDIYIYIDGTTRFKHENSVKELVDQLKGDILLFKHPERNNIDEEAKACVDLELYYKGELFEQQVNSYRNLGYNDNKLFTAGVMVYRKSSKLENMFNEWWGECLAWTQHDQLSFNYLLWKHKIDVSVIDGDLWNNNILTFEYPHA